MRSLGIEILKTASTFRFRWRYGSTSQARAQAKGAEAALPEMGWESSGAKQIWGDERLPFSSLLQRLPIDRQSGRLATGGSPFQFGRGHLAARAVVGGARRLLDIVGLAIGAEKCQRTTRERRYDARQTTDFVPTSVSAQALCITALQKIPSSHRFSGERARAQSARWPGSASYCRHYNTVNQESCMFKQDPLFLDRPLTWHAHRAIKPNCHGGW